MEDAPNEAMKAVEDFEMAYEMVAIHYLPKLKDFRKGYDKLMDAVHDFSVMQGTSYEEDAVARLKKTYQENQDKWGG